MLFFHQRWSVLQHEISISLMPHRSAKAAWMPWYSCHLSLEGALVPCLKPKLSISLLNNKMLLYDATLPMILLSHICTAFLIYIRGIISFQALRITKLADSVHSLEEGRLSWFRLQLISILFTPYGVKSILLFVKAEIPLHDLLSYTGSFIRLLLFACLFLQQLYDWLSTISILLCSMMF